MQQYVNSSFITIIVLILIIIYLFLSIIRMGYVKQRNNELIESMTCKDVIIEEYSKIRHEYNNILQTITCYIEAEEMEELIKFKSIVLEKTHLFNRNSITQLAKIKDNIILSAVYKLNLEAEQIGVMLNIAIAVDITDQSSFSLKHYYMLQECLRHAYESGLKEDMTINLSITGNDKGIKFSFNSESNEEAKKLISNPEVSKKCLAGNNTIINSFIKNHHYIQEILISK